MTERYAIDEHPNWTEWILPLLFVNGERPQRGRGGSGRIEVREPGDSRVRDMLLRFEIRCITCGRWIRPIRERKVSTPTLASLYCTLSCEQAVRPGCSRNAAAVNEQQRVIALIHGWTDPRQPSLFAGVMP